MSQSSSFEKFLFGVLLGGAVGALLAVLTTPRSGDETRKLIREELNTRYDDSKEVLGKQYKESREKFDKTWDESKVKFNDSWANAKDAGAYLSGKAKVLGDDLKETGKEAFDRLKNPTSSNGGDPEGSHDTEPVEADTES